MPETSIFPRYVQSCWYSKLKEMDGVSLELPLVSAWLPVSAYALACRAARPCRCSVAGSLRQVAAAYVLYHHYYRTLALDRLVQLSLSDMLLTFMHVFDSDKRVPEPIRSRQI